MNWWKETWEQANAVLEQEKKDDAELEYNPVRKRFWVFSGGPVKRGGMKDFKGQFDTLEEAQAKAEEIFESKDRFDPTRLKGWSAHPDNWAHILDSWTGEVGEVKKR